MYTAAVLSDFSKTALEMALLEFEDFTLSGFRFSTAQGGRLPHHMTINLGKFDESLNNITLLGAHVKLQVDRFYYNREIGVCAARVSSSSVYLTTINDEYNQRHITMCLKWPAKPYDSNLLDFDVGPCYILNEPLVLETIIEECH
jgi:hypothetical protein